MKEEKLIIQSNKYNGESKVISMRLPEDMLCDIDKVMDVTGKSRNEILILCMEYALNNLQIK